MAKGLPSLSLAEVVATSGLMSRTDRQYLLSLGDFLTVAEALSSCCLEIDGQRVFGYSPTYFDTPDRAHRQDRRRRGRRSGSRSFAAGGDLVLAGGEVGFREQSVSKYCAGLVAMGPATGAAAARRGVTIATRRPTLAVGPAGPNRGRTP
ncbi:hypothetical protein [Amycolatopsis speibonae]|uniref:Uncharacterized protein n=1 Tax=Amycolatopsis speibonae TaxID=1450224 RepID=A0ABV7PCK3_9PSEU